jgi:hypothetical protein
MQNLAAIDCSHVKLEGLEVRPTYTFWKKNMHVCLLQLVCACIFASISWAIPLQEVHMSAMHGSRPAAPAMPAVDVQFDVFQKPFIDKQANKAAQQAAAILAAPLEPIVRSSFHIYVYMQRRSSTPLVFLSSKGHMNGC